MGTYFRKIDCPNRTAHRRAIGSGGLALAMLVAAPVTAAPRPAPKAAKRGADVVRAAAVARSTVPSPVPVTTATPTTAPPAKGPIRIMVTYIETTSADTLFTLAAAQARAAAQNAAGGVKGRRVEIVPCNARFDIVASEACARLAASSKVDAFIHAAPIVAPPAGSLTTAGVSDSGTIVPILASAGIPWLGTFITAGGEEATNPVAFPVASVYVAVEGVAITLANEGCRRIAFIGGPNGREPFRRGLASKGIEPVFESLFFQTDPTTAIPALVARNVDCIYLGALESGIRTFVDAADRAGQKFRYGWVNDLVSERGLALLGPAIDGSIVGSSARSSLDIADPSVRQYRLELDRFYPGKRYDTGAFGIWGATDLALQAMRGIDGEVNSTSTLSALRSFKGDTALFGPVDFTKPLADPQYARMFITNSFNYRIVNAKQTRIGDALDLAYLFGKAP